MEEEAAADQEVVRTLRSNSAQRTRASLSPTRGRPTSAMSGRSDRSHFSYVSGVSREDKDKDPIPPPTIQGEKKEPVEGSATDRSDSTTDLTGSDAGGKVERKKRKRGRPRLDPDADPNVGDGYLARARRREEAKERQREELEREREEGITDPTVVPSPSARTLRKQAALEKVLKEE